MFLSNKRYTKTLVLMLVILMFTGVWSYADTEPSAWANEAINKLKTNETIDPSFFTNYKEAITRKDFAYLAVKLYESLSNSESISVVDEDSTLFVDTNDTYVIKAFKLGIINGYGNGQFGPNDLVTREQINVMLVKTLGIADINLSKDQIENLIFKDQAEISTWALESVRLAYKHKIMNGVAELTIAPKQNTTREQALFLVQNVLDNKDMFVTQVKVAEEIEETQMIKNPVAVIELESGGKIEIELYPAIAPNTVANFVSLADSGFYEGLIFHRVISDFMIQGGDPTGTGTGGTDYSIAGEFSENGIENSISHTRGVISMARATAFDSAGSQFFIMHQDGRFLDGKYAGFGKVINGIEYVDSIANVETDNRDKPLKDVTIKSIVIEYNKYEPTTPIKIE